MPEELPYAEVTEPEFKQVELSEDEAELYGTTLMNLITAGLECGTSYPDGGDDLHEAEMRLKNAYFWANAMNDLVNIKAAQAGLGMPI